VYNQFPIDFNSELKRADLSDIFHLEDGCDLILFEMYSIGT
jgi:hypothetical protein